MIKGSVQGQELLIGSPVIVADTINYLTAEFIFRTSDWDGLVKIAHFSNGTNFADIELIDDQIPSSAGLNLSEGKWTVSLTGHAYDGEVLAQRITTTQARLTVKPSAVPDGEPIESLPSYGEEIIGRVQGIENDVSELKESIADSCYVNLYQINENKEDHSVAGVTYTYTNNGWTAVGETSAGNTSSCTISTIDGIYIEPGRVYHLEINGITGPNLKVRIRKVVNGVTTTLATYDESADFTINSFVDSLLIQLFVNMGEEVDESGVTVGFFTNYEQKNIIPRIENLEKYTNLFEEDYNGDIALECIFHDNFHRTGDGENIGQNGTESVPMEYNYEGSKFQIMDNILVNLKNAETRSVHPLQPQVNLKPPFVIQIGWPEWTEPFYVSFAYNFEAMSGNKTDVITLYCPNNGYCGFTLRQQEYNQYLNILSTDRNASYLFTGDKILVYVGTRYIGYFDYNGFNNKLEFGLCRFISKTAIHKCSVFNVFKATSKLALNPGIESDKFDFKRVLPNSGAYSPGRLYNTCIKQKVSTHANEQNFIDHYSYFLARDNEITNNSLYSEKFHLKYLTSDDITWLDSAEDKEEEAREGSRRTEVEIQNQIRGTLSRFKINFDFCYANDGFKNDIYTNNIMQILTPPDENEGSDVDEYGNKKKREAFSPTILISSSNAFDVSGSKLNIIMWGKSSRDDKLPSQTHSTLIEEIEPLRWYNVDVDVKFGYMPEHNPHTFIKIDGKRVFENFDINAPVSVKSPVFAYGIYKPYWYDEDKREEIIGYPDVQERTVYFDNIKFTCF